jgi:hypothetical protein
MTKTARIILKSVAAATFMIAVPMASVAQCPAGYTYSSQPGGGFSCTPDASSVPEIGASASTGGVAVLFCGIAMLRSRKRVHVK